MRPQYQLPQGLPPEGDTCPLSGVTADQRSALAPMDMWIGHTFMEPDPQEILRLAQKLGESLG